MLLRQDSWVSGYSVSAPTDAFEDVLMAVETQVQSHLKTTWDL